MPRKLCHFDKGRILPYTELILGVAVRAEQLLAGCGPNQTAYLIINQIMRIVIS